MTSARSARRLVRSFGVACATAFAGAAGTAPAQGLRWSTPLVQPTLHVREHLDRSWTLCFDGWSMTAGVPLLGGDEAATVGVPPAARTVSTSSAEVLKGGSGGTALLPLFPFVPDPRVAARFAARMPGLDRFGFLAPIGGGVPEAGLAAIAFRVQLAQPLSASALLPMLATARMGVVTADATANPTGTFFVVGPGRVQPARLLDYAFDAGIGTEVINRAGIEGGAFARAPMQHPAGTPWTTGRFGGGLRAGATVDSGFAGDLGMRFTLAWFMRGGTAPTSASPVVTLGGFRVFTGGAAGAGMRCSGAHGGGALDLGVDVQARAAAAWTHVALVVDGDAGQARWFVDGVLQATLPIAGVVGIPGGGGTLLVGSTPMQTCVYDLDEVRLTSAAESAGTIATWSTRSSPAAVPFTDTCGANVRVDGIPRPGSSLRFRIEGPPAALAMLTLGLGRRLAGIPLPVDLGFIDPSLAGCEWHSDLTFVLPVAPIPASGVGSELLTLPNLAGLVGIDLRAQALVRSAAWTAATNASLVAIR